MKLPDEFRPSKATASILFSVIATGIWALIALPFGDSSDSAESGPTSPAGVSGLSTVPEPTPTITLDAIDESSKDGSPSDSADADDSSPSGDREAANASLDITEARIEVSSSGKVGPNSWEYGSRPGYEPVVVTESKRLDRSDGCYVQWAVTNNGVTLDTDSTACAARGGFSEAYWPMVKYQRGTVKVTAKISTDWGESAVATVEFAIV